MANTSEQVRILGQRVRVHRNGIVWTNPDDGTKYVIGASRLEAAKYLEDWASNRPREMRQPIRRAVVSDEERSAIKMRMYLCALYYATARAKRAGTQIMSRAEFLAMVERSQHCCEVTGIKFSSDVPEGARKAMWAPSIDRMDCRGSYEASNCRLVCVAVNLAMNEFGAEVLMTIAKAMTGRRT